MKKYLFILPVFFLISYCFSQKESEKEAYRIAIIQFDSFPEQNERNVKEIERLAQKAAAMGSKIILFHENTVADYTGDVEKNSEYVPDGPSCRKIEALAKKLNLYLAFGISEKTRDNHYYITHVFMGPKGFIYKYRKTWIWRDEDDKGYRNEWARYDVGNGPEIFKLAGLRATCFICADGEAPRCIQRAQLLKPDIVFYPNNRAAESEYAKYAERAAQIKATMLVANRVGKSWQYDCRGGCAVISSSGEILAKTSTNQEEILIYDLQK